MISSNLVKVLVFVDVKQVTLRNNKQTGANKIRSTKMKKLMLGFAVVAAGAAVAAIESPNIVG